MTTGRNGWEEIVAACDAVQPIHEIDRASESGRTLAEKRAALRDLRVSRTLALLRRGLAKPLTSPQDVADEAWMACYAPLRKLARLLSLEQFTRLADGNVTGAIDSLRDCLRLAYAVQQEQVIGGLVGIAMNGIVIRRMQRHVEQLSEPGCRKLLALAADWMSAPDPALAAIESERARLKEGLEPELMGLAADIRRDVARRLDRRIDALLAELRKPYPSRKPLPALDEGDMAEQFLKALELDRTFEQAARRFVKEQAEVQLLGAHAAVRLFLWEKDRLPGSLAELVLPERTTDPWTGKPFEYRRTGERSYSLSAAEPPDSP